MSVPYSNLLQREHWEEIMGEPVWTYHRWRYANPVAHVEAYRRLHEEVGLDVLQPVAAPTWEQREYSEVFRRDGDCFLVDRRSGEERRLSQDLPHMEGASNQERRVFTRRDADRIIRPTPAAEVVAEGVNDYRREAVRAMGREVFILTGGVVGVLWHATAYVGQTNVLVMLREEPDLLEHICRRLLACNIEQIRVLAEAGGDAVYIDDAMATTEMISPDDYERFSMPYLREMIREVQAHGMKAILIYFGGVADRVEMIDSLGADGLMVETTMKNYVNDIEDIAARLGGETCLFGNIDPVGVLWRGSAERLEQEVGRQARVGRSYGRFVMSTGSPVTPGTPLRRIRRFVDLAHRA